MEITQDSEEYWSSSARENFFSFDDGFDNLDNSDAISPKWNVLNEVSVFENETPTAINLSVNNFINEEALSTILQEQSLDECIIPKGVSIDEEIKILRRQIQTTLYSPAAETTALKLLQGKCPTLEVFRSLHEKQHLLDVALQQYGGGDGIMGVLLFLKRTLNRDNFLNILRDRPKALQHYLSYLKSNNDCESEAIEILQHFGQHQELILMRFKTAMDCDDIMQRKRKLKLLLETYGDGAAYINSTIIQVIQNTFKLIEFVEKQRNFLDNMIDLNSKPIEVLYACCRKYKNWKDEDITHSLSPYRLALEQNISPTQFEWTALNERTISQAYADLEAIFERLSAWRPIKQKQFHISFSIQTAVLRLFHLKAPNTVLYLFLSKMSNSADKFEISKKVKCTKATIDALVGLKDYIQLAQLKDELPERTEEHFYCEKAIKSIQNKRWSTDNIKMKL